MASGSRPSRRRAKHVDYLILIPALLAVAGCPTRDKYEPAPAVRITSPAIETTYTNATVRITAAIDPVLDLPIVLLDNGVPLTTLGPPAYTLDWVTAGVPEGNHTIVAEVMLSGGPVRSPHITVVVDRTPPTVVTRTPESGAADVRLRTPVQVAFSEPIVLLLPADATFTLALSGGAAVATHTTFDEQGRTASVAIDDPTALPLPTTLVATVGSAITDRAGNPLVLSSARWSWGVPDFVKRPPSALCPILPSTNRLPALAIGRDLQPVVASAAPLALADGVHCQLQVSRHDGRQWIRYDGGPSGPLADDVDSAMRGAALALMPDDQPIVAWRPNAAPDPGEIDVAAWTGTAWQTLPAIVPVDGVLFPNIHPVLRVGTDGRPVLLWAAGLTAARTFLARWNGSSWNEEFAVVPIVSPQPFDGPHFDMILDERNNPIVGWVNPSSRGHVALWNGSAWSPAPDLFNMTDGFVALDSARAPMIVSGASGTFFVEHRVGADAWQPQPAVAVPPQARHPRIGSGEDGLPVIAWYDAQTKSVGMGRWTGQRWDTRMPFFSPSNAVDESPQLVVDRWGTAWIGWRDTDGLFNLWMLNF